ncbi:unnamed protein product [marine sediment metagenome]|uniref:Glutamate/phenylalanine/leucine/valine/L-tryptophan dehydrogenase C-terminal domain-containing protein n=1 Tax=marine sediment metagenome TaxID=412755 RepID=X1ECQ4_9ZZZZ
MNLQFDLETTVFFRKKNDRLYQVAKLTIDNDREYPEAELLITVSYFEWVQGLQAYFWTEREVNLRLRDIMQKAFGKVYRISEERKVTMRKAAYILAVERVAEATRVRGLYP